MASRHHIYLPNVRKVRSETNSRLSLNSEQTSAETVASLAAPEAALPESVSTSNPNDVPAPGPRAAHPA